jgi:hypothetical protein
MASLSFKAGTSIINIEFLDPSATITAWTLSLGQWTVVRRTPAQTAMKCFLQSLKGHASSLNPSSTDHHLSHAMRQDCLYAIVKPLPIW